MSHDMTSGAIHEAKPLSATEIKLWQDPESVHCVLHSE